MNDLQYYFLPTVSQSNHDNVRVIIKDCAMDYFYFSASRRKRGLSPGPLDNSRALKVQCLRVPHALLDNRFFYYYFEKRSKHSHNWTARQCSPLRRKFMEYYIINPAQ